MIDSPPCILFEDEHLLAVNKPAGLNTHAPSPFAGEGIYDWLRHREPRWASLAIMHRLDKDTSGTLLFTKTRLAHQSLTQQFTSRSVRKKYLFLTDRPVVRDEFSACSNLVRLGERYVSRRQPAGVRAETHFQVLNRDPSGLLLIQAEPVTGRTHQIRVQAADHGLPILGDRLYGGSAFQRLCLHSAELTVQHPATGEPITFRVPPDFQVHPSIALREGLLDPKRTNTYRVVHGAADGRPGTYLDRLGAYALIASAEDWGVAEASAAGLLQPLVERPGLRGVYHKVLTCQPGRAEAQAASPRLVRGEAAPDEFVVLENGVTFGLSFKEGYSFGLFLDQRDNRRRLLTGHVAAQFPAFDQASSAKILNVFSYTCAFSVCATKAGAHTTSLDLSRKYLDWGQRNFRLNELDLQGHEFIYGDAFDWMRRFGKKKRTFDLIILDPPSFSRSKEYGTFQAEKDYPALLNRALPLLKPNGVLLASTNLATFKPEAFLDAVTRTVQSNGRAILQRHYAPQPTDFPITREEPGHLKTVWLRVR